MADAAHERRGDAEGVEMRIWFDRTDPPVGYLRWQGVAGTPSDGITGPTRFSGWLGLLRALSDALNDQEDIPHEQ
jgi:hypothetical protein